MDFSQAYENLSKGLLPVLSKVDSEQSSREFVSHAVREIRNQASTVPEFYVGEFFNLFKDAAVQQGRNEVAAYEEAIKDNAFEADLATVELNVRLTAAEAADDKEAVHAVWRERDERQAALHARRDALSGRIGTLDFRLEAINSLASALDLNFG